MTSSPKIVLIVPAMSGKLGSSAEVIGAGSKPMGEVKVTWYGETVEGSSPKAVRVKLSLCTTGSRVFLTCSKVSLMLEVLEVSVLGCGEELFYVQGDSVIDGGCR
jgi:ABC-type iron transport system FetAB ATPase subunit